MESVSMDEPKSDAQLEDTTETTATEAGNETHEESHVDEDIAKEDKLEIATDEAINENDGENNGEEDGKGIEVVNNDNIMMAPEMDGDDFDESDPSIDISDSEDGDEYNLPYQNSEDDEANENNLEGDVDGDEVSEGEPMEEEIDDEDVSEEESSEEGDPKNAIGEKETVDKGGGRDSKEMEVKLKGSDKSSNRKSSKGQADKSEKIESADKPEPSRKGKGKGKMKSMGMIFLCSSKTKDDCFRYRVFGLPESKKDVVEKIYKGMRLFLYDVDLKLMYGIYKAAAPGGYNIEPKAFKSQFPSQVHYTVLDDCLPLPEEKFKKVIKKNYFTKTKFDCQLNSLQVKQLCKLFIASRKGPRRAKPGRGPKALKPRSVIPDRTERERPERKRRLAPRDERIHLERPRKRTRKIISPCSPPPLPPAVPSYAYDRPSNADSYRRERGIYRESHRTYRDDHPYRDTRDPLLERRDSYRDGGREPYLSSRDSYRVAREPYLDHHDRYRDPYLEPRDTYKDRRDSYLEHLNPYRDERVSSYQVTRDHYIGRLDPYIERGGLHRDDPYVRDPHPLVVDRQDAYRESGRVEYRDIYRSREPFERIDSRPLTLESRRPYEISERDPRVELREHPSYLASIYSADYLSRDGVARTYHL